MDKKPGGFQQQTIDRENMETNKKHINKKNEELIYFLLLGENRVSKYFSVILMQRQLHFKLLCWRSNKETISFNCWTYKQASA